MLVGRLQTPASRRRAVDWRPALRSGVTVLGGDVAAP
jgi:hypothetical protein